MYTLAAGLIAIGACLFDVANGTSLEEHIKGDFKSYTLPGIIFGFIIDVTIISAALIANAIKANYFF